MMLNLGLGLVRLLAVTLLFTAAASAQDGEAEGEDLVFARPGFYGGVGITAAFPSNWSRDFDSDLDKQTSALATDIAQDNLDPSNPPRVVVVPLSFSLDSDLEDTLLGANWVAGYRAGERVAFEIEGEWLIDSNRSNLDVTGSVGSHTAKVSKIGTLTANVRMFLPFDWRVQPYVVFGAGVQHSSLEFDIVTSGVTTTDDDTGTIVVPADFVMHSTRTELTGAIRLGGGIDAYATRNIVVQLNTTYVLPFEELGSIMTTDYIAVGGRLIYRF
jgi:opacity protein-like surface antigen